MRAENEYMAEETFGLQKGNGQEYVNGELKISSTNNREEIKYLLANLFNRITYKLHLNIQTCTREPQAFEVLKSDVKKDLFIITAHHLEQTYLGLLEEGSLVLKKKKVEQLLLDLHHKILQDFLHKQYGFVFPISCKPAGNSLFLDDFLTDWYFIFVIPFYALVNPRGSAVLTVFFPIYSFVSENLLEAFLDNLILRLANTIIIFCFLYLSFLYPIRQTLFKARFISLRNYEKYKNNTIWSLRVQKLLKRPSLLYNNQYNLMIIQRQGINSRTVFSNRSRDLVKLRGFPLYVVTFLESKDFISSRLSDFLYYSSTLVNFTLKNVIGQSIGLIWQGIILNSKKDPKNKSF